MMATDLERIRLPSTSSASDPQLLLEHTMGKVTAALENQRAGGSFRAAKAGVDLGTAHIMILALDDEDHPLAGAYERAAVVRDGVVVDFAGASQILRRLKHDVEQRLGTPIPGAQGAYPPGVGRAESTAVRHVIESAELECTGLIDEPSAANAVLKIHNGAIVDIGGGTTGVAVIHNSEVVHTVDEATGGHHLSLVLAGHLNIDLASAEALKRDPTRQPGLLPVVRPVLEKIGAIIAEAIRGHRVETIHLVGGSVMFPGFADIIAQYTGVPTRVPPHPMLITPLGIAQATTVQSPTSSAGLLQSERVRT